MMFSPVTAPGEGFGVSSVYYSDSDKDCWYTLEAPQMF